MLRTLHPFLKNRIYSLYYFLAWILVAGIHLFLLVWQEAFPFYVAIGESLFSTIILALLGLFLWYPVRFMQVSGNQPFFLMAGYLLAGAFMVVVWKASSDYFLPGLFAGEERYPEYLKRSETLKILSGAFIYFITILVYYLIISRENLKEKTRQESRLEALVRESELKMLRSQINPHFLFNSLNSIASLTLTDTEKAHRMVIRLSEFFRYSLDHSSEEESTLAGELDHISNYLEIEKVRFGERLSFRQEIPDECIEMKLPSLILQPLFENAIKHGVYENTGPVQILFSAVCEGSQLQLKLTNTYDPETVRRGRKGIGLKNIEQRLRLKYRQEGLIRINKKDGLFEVHLMLPQ